MASYVAASAVPAIAIENTIAILQTLDMTGIKALRDRIIKVHIRELARSGIKIDLAHFLALHLFVG